MSRNSRGRADEESQVNVSLWIAQALLAAAFLAAGWIKLFRPKEKIAANPRLGWANDYTASQVKLIGLAEVLGAPGLVLPLYLRILPILTPVAAACLAVIMGGAVHTHVRRGETPLPATLLGLMAAFVAVGRFLVTA